MGKMNILDNELVQKYFGTEHKGCPLGCNYDHDGMTAHRILESMQEPIHAGARYLFWNGERWSEECYSIHCTTEIYVEPFHPYCLRLPSKFQPAGKKECECIDAKLLMETHLARFHCPPNNQPPPAPEKCANANVIGHHAAQDCGRWCCKPADSGKCEKAGVPGHHAITDCTCKCCHDSEKNESAVELARKTNV